MTLDNEPKLVDAISIYDLSPDEDLEYNFGELVETYFDSPVDENINLVYEDSDYSTPSDLLRANLITKGQYLLFVVNEFDAQLRDGGLAQFISNKPEWIADVAQALNLLEMTDFHDEFAKEIKGLQSYFGDEASSGDDENAPELHRLSIEYGLLAERLSDTLIDRHYQMRWSNKENRLYWDPSQWSQQLLQKMIAFAQAHPFEFRHVN